MPSPSSSSSTSPSSSTDTSRSRRRVTFMETDDIGSMKQVTFEATENRVPQTVTPSMVNPQTETPHTISSTVPLPCSPNCTSSTLSTSGPYTPPSNFEGDTILIQEQGTDITNSDEMPSLSDPVVLEEANALDTYKDLIHACLTTSNPVEWDMLTDPQTPPRPHALVQFGGEFMTSHAFPDSVSKIRLNCDLLPRPLLIDIQPDADPSPRVEDLMESIYKSLCKLASSADFNGQTTERQRVIQKAYRRRCGRSSPAGERDGLRRIDFLENQTMFLGLSPGDHDDEWHLHVGPRAESNSGAK